MLSVEGIVIGSTNHGQRHKSRAKRERCIILSCSLRLSMKPVGSNSLHKTSQKIVQISIQIPLRTCRPFYARSHSHSSSPFHGSRIDPQFFTSLYLLRPLPMPMEHAPCIRITLKGNLHRRWVVRQEAGSNKSDPDARKEATGPASSVGI